MKRRRFLKATGIVAASAVAGCITSRQPPNQLGSVFTTDAFTLRVTDRFIDDENRTALTIDAVNVTDEPQSVDSLASPTLTVGRARHDPVDNTMKSSELVSGELLRYTLRYPVDVTDERATLTVQDRPVLVNDPERELDDQPQLRLGYAEPLEHTRQSVTQNGVEIDVERLAFRDHLPIFGEQARVTFTNTSDDAVSLPQTPAVIKGPDGRESASALDNRTLEPGESRDVELVHFIFDSKRTDTAYVGVDLDYDAVGTKHLFKL